MDTGLALVVLLLVVLPWAFRPAGSPGISWFGVVVNLGTALPLIWRRRAPLAVMCVIACFGAAVAYFHDPGQNFPYGPAVGLYTVAHMGRRWQRQAVLWTIVVSSPIVAVLKHNTLVDFLLTVAVFGGAYLLGRLAGTRQAHLEALQERALRLEQATEFETARAAARERARIARDMHDILSHAVSLMVVQAEAGPVVVTSDPDRAVAAFDAIADAGRDAMAQLRRMLGVLKEEDAAGPRAPHPTVGAIPDLIAQVERAGLSVESHVAGVPRPLPPDSEIAAYRIVQEALTNAVKHASATMVTVTMDWSPDAISIRITDDGRGSPGPLGAGNGLIGIRERAASCGGTASAGFRDDTDGFEVAVRLPVPTTMAAGQLTQGATR
jgi:signal transduction histidine kinase